MPDRMDPVDVYHNLDLGSQGRISSAVVQLEHENPWKLENSNLLHCRTIKSELTGRGSPHIGIC